MINYSIVMRSVNANLFDINQAKSRIKAAEKAGQTPSSEDVALVGQRDRYVGSQGRANVPVPLPPRSTKFPDFGSERVIADFGF